MRDAPADRLRLARQRAGYSGPAEAARAFGWKENTYKSHENGLRGIARHAERYARAFRVSCAWLLTGEGPAEQILSPDENDLLADFRRLPVNEQQIVRVFCAALAERAAGDAGPEKGGDDNSIPARGAKRRLNQRAA